jgi:thymidine kinase
MELADERQELQVEARCWCGARATMNARLVDGRVVYEGDVVMVGDTTGEGEVTYELLCRRHWRAGETGRLLDADLRGSVAPPERKSQRTGDKTS